MCIRTGWTARRWRTRILILRPTSMAMAIKYSPICKWGQPSPRLPLHLF